MHKTRVWRRVGTLALAWVAGCGAEQVSTTSDFDADTASSARVVAAPAALASSATAALLASQDSTVRASVPNQNFGAASELDVNRTLVQFDNVALRALVGAQDVVVSAQLELTLTNNALRKTTATRQVSAFRLTQVWSEYGSTWNCAKDDNTTNHRANCPTKWSMGAQPPNPWAEPATNTITVAARQTGIALFDVTADVRKFASGTLSNNGWMLKGSTAGEFAEFASRETTTPPRLLLTIRRCSPTLCDDGNACTQDSCDASANCVNAPVADGSACSDSNACTQTDTCQAGHCSGANLIVCAAADQCHQAGSCNPSTGACSTPALPNGTLCNDGNACTQTDTCQTGTCSGANPLACTALDACHQPGSCSPDTGTCSNPPQPVGASCTGGNVCDGQGTCVQCVVASNCPGSDSTCGERTCVSGMCGVAFDPAGTLCGPDQACNGSGACVGVPHIVINEVESNGGVPGDWVELYNAGTAAVDVSSWKFLDNDNTHAPYVIPVGTSIAAGGYLVLEEANFVFGLGSADSSRLFDASGVTVVDSYSWSAHATTTYGRCPNGTGALTTTVSSTKGAANDCGGTTGDAGVDSGVDAGADSGTDAGVDSGTDAGVDSGTDAGVASVVVNEVESNGGVPGDWVELYNAGTAAVDVSSWKFLDNDNTHAPYVIPVGTSIAAGGYLVLEEANFVFGLGSADSSRLFDASGVTVVDSYSWLTHATTTYGRCPNGSGAFRTTTSVTKGAANDCSVAVKINEVESNGGVPGDWTELYNAGSTSVDLSGWVLKDNDDTHLYTIPAGTSIAAGAYLVLDEAVVVFGLGSADSTRLYDATGTLIDTYSWTAHATTTYGRCPNGTGAFATTLSATKGTGNDCPGATPPPQTWPGANQVTTVDAANTFGSNLSGLMYEPATSSAPAVLWAVRNGPSTLFRLAWNGSIWAPEVGGGWDAGKTVHYTDGTGAPDSEGVTKAELSSPAVYVVTERNNDANSVSRLSILRFDTDQPGADLTATHDWNLTADLPVVGANLGLEGITWIPDSMLVAKSFADESTGHAYDPTLYPNHGTGLFFVGIEANGMIYAYALNHVVGGFQRVATINSGNIAVMDLSLDRDVGYLWAQCDDTCNNQAGALDIDTNALSPTFGKFVVRRQFARPASMPNINNEGIAIAPESECVGGFKNFFWSDDNQTDGHALRRDSIPCGPFL